MALFCPRPDHRLGASDLGQPLLAPRQFLGHLHPVRYLGLIGDLRLTQRIGHFGGNCASILLACSYDSALRQLALVWILVPSSATVPSFKTPISRATPSTCTNSA